MNDYCDISTAARLIGCDERHVRRLCRAGKLPGAFRKGGAWFIPPAAHPKLPEAVSAAEVQGEELMGVSARKINKAVSRLKTVRELGKFVAEFSRSTSRTKRQAGEVFAKQNNIGLRTLQRWHADYRREGLAGLVDYRGGGFNSPALSPDAAEIFKALYLTQQRLSLKQCWQNLCYVNKSESRNWQIPRLRSMYHWVDCNIPQPVQILLREGKAAYDAKCGPYIQAEPDSYQPGQCWVGDHHQFNFWVRYRGKWVRPWLTAWMDWRSRMTVGWHISACPNQTTVLLAMKAGIENYGPPDVVKIDNGKDYDSEMWTGTTKARRRAVKAGYIDEQWVGGLYAWMGIDVGFSQKYHPQSKPIERLFATIDEQFSKTIPTYCGKDPQRRPENVADLLKSDKAIAEACTIDTLAQKFTRYIKAYNRSPHNGIGMDGKSPVAVFETRRSRRVIDKNTLSMLMSVWSGELKIGKNGVRFKNMLYGQYESELLARFGKKVRVAYDPQDVRRVTVYDAKSMSFICVAEQNQLIKYGDKVSEEATRQAQHTKGQIRKAFRAYRDASALAGLDLTDLTIKAIQDSQAAEAKETEAGEPAMRPVKTPLDGQAKQVGQALAFRELKKAAGAESMSEQLDLDLTLLRRKGDRIKLDFLSDEK